MSSSSAESREERKYFLPEEVSVHNKRGDAWVVVHGKVVDISHLFRKPLSAALRYLLAFAGKDLSHFFRENGIPKTRVTLNGTEIPLLAATLEQFPGEQYWWQDEGLVIGFITARPRRLRVINTLTLKTKTMTVCEEDSLEVIRQKYRKYNWHLDGYHWNKYDPELDRYSGLCWSKTLTENGLPFEGDVLPPAIWLRFKDDRTVA